MKKGQKDQKADADEDIVFQNMQPFIAKNKLSAKPSDDEVNRAFDNLLTDLDYHGKMLTKFSGWSTDMKVKFVQQQEDHERTVPSPEWVIEQLTKESDPRYVTSIRLSIRTSRLSWIDRFCTSGGHILLLRELARLTAFSQFFHHSFPYNNKERVGDVIRALKSCVDCRHGSQHMLYFVPGIEIITSAINRYDFQQFETLLYLLVPYVFMDSGPRLLLNAFSHLAELNQQKHIFRIFTDIIQANSQAASKSEIFLAFLNGLYTTLSQKFVDKIDVVFSYSSSDLINMFSKLPEDVKTSFGPALPVFLESINADLNEITQLFKGAPFKCAKVEDLIKEFEDQRAIGSIITNLVSIKRNQPKAIDRVISLLYNFLLFVRKRITDSETVDNIEHSFDEIAFQAFDYALPQSGIEVPPIPTESNILNNTCYQHLHESYNYIADDDFELFCTSWECGEKEREVKQLREQVKSLQSEVAKVRKELEENSQEARLASELEKYKEELERNKKELEENKKKELEENSQEAKLASELAKLEKYKLELEQKANEEVAKLKEELEKTTAENERLRASQSIITELAAYVPTDLKKIELRALDVNQILPLSKVDINSLLGQIMQLKSKVGDDPSFDSILSTLEGQLRQLLDERSSIERNASSAIQTIREDRVALSAEFNQIREIQIKIIEGLSAGNLLDDQDISRSEQNTEKVKTIENVAPPQPVFNFPWKKLPDHHGQTHQWAPIVNGMPEVNANEVIQYFAVNEIPEEKLISLRTEKSLNHILAKSNLTPDSITREISSQSFKLDENLLTLIFNLPVSNKEQEKLAIFDGDLSTLSNAEKLAVLLYRIPEWRQKVSQSIELHKFDNDITILMQNLTKIQGALAQLKNSKNLPVLISGILALGNFLNGGTEFGGAYGFSLNNLKDLKHTRSNIKGVSLLNYIAFCVERQGFNMSALQTELDKLQPATRYSLIDINEKLKNAQILLASRARDPFVRASSRRVYDSIGKVALIQKEYNEIERIYGIQEELLRPGYLIQLIIDFATDFSRALKENRTNGLKGGQLAAPLGQQTSSSTGASSTASRAEAEEEKQRGMLNQMLGVLSQPGRTNRNQANTGGSDFNQAFAKVQKSVLH